MFSITVPKNINNAVAAAVSCLASRGVPVNPGGEFERDSIVGESGRQRVKGTRKRPAWPGPRPEFEQSQQKPTPGGLACEGLRFKAGT